MGIAFVQNIDIKFYQSSIDSLVSLYLILDLKGEIVICNESVRRFVLGDLKIKRPELKGEIVGMTYADLTLTGNWGDTILAKRVSAFEECLSTKCKKKIFDINRNEILEGVISPVFDEEKNVKFIIVNLEVVTEKKILEFKKNLHFFSPKEKSFLEEIVKHKSTCTLYNCNESFINFYHLNMSEATKRKIDKILMSDTGVFNRSAYVNNINNKIIQHAILTNEFLIIMKLFYLNSVE